MTTLNLLVPPSCSCLNVSIVTARIIIIIVGARAWGIIAAWVGYKRSAYLFGNSPAVQLAKIYVTWMALSAHFQTLVNNTEVMNCLIFKKNAT